MAASTERSLLVSYSSSSSDEDTHDLTTVDIVSPKCTSFKRACTEDDIGCSVKRIAAGNGADV